MKKERVITFLALIVLAIWVLIAGPVQGNIFRYINEKYLAFIYWGAAVCFFVGTFALYFDLSKSLKSDAKKTKQELNEIAKFIGTLLTIILVIILGITISPIFFVIAGILLFRKEYRDFAKDILSSKNVLYTILFLVVSLAILFPSEGIRSTGADQRYSSFNGTTTLSGDSIAQKFNADTTSYNLGEWVNSLAFNPDYSYYVGKEVKLTGFIFSPDKFENGTFLISRFVVRCCAADASPVGLKVKYQDWEKTFKEDQWVEIKGKFCIIF